ncbi:MAG: BrnA antitoxin family protein [Pseudomonadota bacterium]
MSRKKDKPVVFDDDNPEWTAEDFARATHFPKGTTLGEAVAHMMRQRGRPKLDKPKEAIKLRLDADVLEAYRKTGDGWQTRINADLRKARKLKTG